ncbi:MAG: cytidylate kinase-like family protein [Candidatus Latescibacteria bacterium]|nr:cytidylate kinase-like family protein [Candidatus Latescibacterota bacterium]
MNTAEARLADRRVTEWFVGEKARREREYEERTAATASRVQTVRSVITISRQFGAGGHTVVQAVAERLGPQWQVWDKEIIEQLAHSAQVRTEMVEALDEQTQSWMGEMIHTLFKGYVLETMGYRRYLAQVLLALAQQGNKILLGRGANFVLRDALNVRLRASEECRAQVIMQRDSITHAEALKKIHQVDHDRAAFTRTVFNREVDNPSEYDMTLQTDTLGLDAAAAAIVAACQAKFETAV